jgi:hypothetical protein
MPAAVRVEDVLLLLSFGEGKQRSFAAKRVQAGCELSNSHV